MTGNDLQRCTGCVYHNRIGETQNRCLHHSVEQCRNPDTCERFYSSDTVFLWNGDEWRISQGTYDSEICDLCGKRTRAHWMTNSGENHFMDVCNRCIRAKMEVRK